MSPYYAWREIATVLAFINSEVSICLFEKPHPNSSEISSSISHCPDFSSGEKAKAKPNQPTGKKKKNSVGALRLRDKLEIDPHPAIHVHDTQGK